MSNYYKPKGELPAQRDMMTGRAVFTEAYAVIPKRVMAHPVASFLPHWENTCGWIVARPMSGFAETFSHYITEVSPGGGSNRPEPDNQAECVLFVVAGNLTLTMDETVNELTEGGYAYIPAGTKWSLWNHGSDLAQFHWIRKDYEAVEGIAPPDALVTSDKNITRVEVPDTEGRWAVTAFTPGNDLRYDMSVSIITFQPGGVLPFEETHVMEHGIYILSGKGVYRLNRDWVEVEAGDFIWLRAFCPQACYAGGPEPFRYLLYKDINRHAKLGEIHGRK